MKKRMLSLLAAAVLCAAMAGCVNEDEQIQPTAGATEAVTEQVTEAPTEAKPIVVQDVERETAPDGTEFVTSLIETTYPDGTVTVESRSEILYPDGTAYCESQMSVYHTDGTKTVENRTTKTDAEGSETVLDSMILEYDAAGQLIEN